MTEVGLLERMRRRGIRVTPQRRAVACAFAESGPVHLTAEEVLERARLLVPEISRATTYNTLNELVACGELRTVSFDSGPLRFDPNVSDGHSHAVCRTCGSVDDVPPPTLAGVPEQATFAVEHAEVVFHGVCARCAN